jgi:hypothetical protein
VLSDPGRELLLGDFACGQGEDDRDRFRLIDVESQAVQVQAEADAEKRGALVPVDDGMVLGQSVAVAGRESRYVGVAVGNRF